jgi:hypothetical protein
MNCSTDIVKINIDAWTNNGIEENIVSAKSPKNPIPPLLLVLHRLPMPEPNRIEPNRIESKCCRQESVRQPSLLAPPVFSVFCYTYKSTRSGLVLVIHRSCRVFFCYLPLLLGRIAASGYDNNRIILYGEMQCCKKAMMRKNRNQSFTTEIFLGFHFGALFSLPPKNWSLTEEGQTDTTVLFD